MECIFLGTGYSIPTPKRHNTSLFLRTEQTNLLVDCNGICNQQLSRMGISLYEVEHIYLTHRHPDHIAALPGFVHQMWLSTIWYAPEDNRRTTPLNIYANAETIDVVKALFEMIQLPGEPNMFQIKYHQLEDDGGKLSVGDISLEYFPVKHGKTACLGFTATSEAVKRLVYSADTSPCDLLYSKLQEGDVLVHECNDVTKAECGGHTTLAELKSLYSGWPSRTLYLVLLPA